MIAPGFIITQILQPTATALFLQNLVASPVRHAKHEHEDHWYYTVDGKRLLTHKMAFLGISMHLLHKKKILPASQECCSWYLYKVCSSLEQKKRYERVIMGIKIILTSSLIMTKTSSIFSIHQENTYKSTLHYNLIILTDFHGFMVNEDKLQNWSISRFLLRLGYAILVKIW